MTITATESGSAGSATGSVVTFGVTSPATGSFSPTTCTLAGGSCSVSYIPTGTLAAATYTNDLTATFTASGTYAAASATATLTIAASATFSYNSLYSFFGNPDGAKPLLGSLLQASDGNFYGTTQTGGARNYGTIFRIGANGSYTQLYAFTNAPITGTSPAQTDGKLPDAGLVQGSDGSFYGTTYSGGCAKNGGTIFRISAAGVYTQLYAFTGAAIANTTPAQTDGKNPYAGLVQGSDGNFYGTTYVGGSNSDGNVFRIVPSPTLAAPVTLTVPASVTHGTTFTLGYAVSTPPAPPSKPAPPPTPPATPPAGTASKPPAPPSRTLP